MTPAERPIVVGLTGASGVVYARRLIQVLLAAEREVMVSISPAAQQVLLQELQWEVDLNTFDPTGWGDSVERLTYFHHRDLMAPIASGSHRTAGMVICPCSGSTLSAIAYASSNNLIQRAAEVHLKEGRPLILVPRETPLSLPQLANMQIAAQAGATILPASPGWYHGVRTLDDLVDFVVARILDQLGIDHSLTKRWGE